MECRLSRNDFLKPRDICLAFKCHDTSNQGNNATGLECSRFSNVQYKINQMNMIVSRFVTVSSTLQCNSFVNIHRVKSTYLFKERQFEEL